MFLFYAHAHLQGAERKMRDEERIGGEEMRRGEIRGEWGEERLREERKGEERMGEGREGEERGG